MTTLLTVSELRVTYGAVAAVQDVSLEVPAGEIRVLLGANGAGKSTVTRAILGLKRPQSGSIVLDGRSIVGMPPHQVHRAGIAWVPQGRQVWATLTVLENLQLAADRWPRSEGYARIQAQYDRFPRLRERERNLAGQLSGGEQQMVAIARALITEPRLLLMDEPTLGLAPKVVSELFELVGTIRDTGVSILMAEQNARHALKIADWAYVLDGGRTVMSGAAGELAMRDEIQDIYLGGKA